MFDVRDIAGVDSDYDNFVKEILLRTVRNIKRFCQVLDKEHTIDQNGASHLTLKIVQSWESLPILHKVYKQIIKLVENVTNDHHLHSNSKNEHEISNLFREDDNESENNEH